jgi:hypothetical protein
MSDAKTAKAVAKFEKNRDKQVAAIQKQIAKAQDKLDGLIGHVNKQKATKAFGGISGGLLTKIQAIMDLLNKLNDMLQKLGALGIG